MDGPLQHARKLLRTGQPQHAAAVLDELLKTQPRNPQALQLRALAAQQLGNISEAQKILRQAVKHAPGSWAAHSNLGNVLRTAGQTAEAEGHLRKALSLAPDSALVMVNLANTLLDQKRYDDAIALYRKAVVVDPTKPGAWQGLAIASRQTNDLPSAAEAGRRLAALAPNDAATWNDLGTALMALGELEEAEAGFRRACELAPKNAQPFYNLGTLALKRSDPAVALRAFDAALERAPDMSEARINRAKARFDLGDTQTAIDELRALLEQDPENTDARFRLAEALERVHELEDAAQEIEALMSQDGAERADVRYVAARVARRRGDPEQAIRLLEDVTVPETNDELAGNLHTELGRNLDAAGEYARAFNHFTRANERFGLTTGYKGVATDGFWKTLRTRREALTAEWVQALSRLETEETQPVFLVGFPRSGTTLTEQILSAHPDLDVLGELPPLSDAISRCREMVSDYPADNPELSVVELEELRQVYLAGVAEHVALDANRVLVDKYPLHFIDAPFIVQLFPAAKFVFVLRDPRDAVLSGFMQAFAPNPAMASFLNLKDAANLYDEGLKLWERYRELFDLKVFELRYEDLLEDFDGQVRELLTFVGAKWDESVTAFDRHAREQTIRTPSYSQVSRPIYKTSVGRWRNYETQLQPVMATLAPHVERLGYPPSLPTF